MTAPDWRALARRVGLAKLADPDLTTSSTDRYRFDHEREVVWAAISRVDAYRSWWPWLRRFEADGLHAGARWVCTIRPPMPYLMRFTVAIDHVDPPFRIEATVTGDIRGSAELTLTPDGMATVVELSSALTPEGRALRIVSALAPRLARIGHDRVLATGLTQFRRRALGSGTT